MSPFFQKGVKNTLETYKEIGRCIFLKVNFLHSHLGFFSAILVRSVISKVISLEYTSNGDTVPRFLE